LTFSVTDEGYSRNEDNTIAIWKRTNNDLQNTTHKTKDLAKRTPLKTGGELMRIEPIRHLVPAPL
jgi:hypothetical protein